MPVTLRCIIENNNVDENVAKFMLPIGSAINMDGTALYEGIICESNQNVKTFNRIVFRSAVAAIFVAQLREIDLPFGKLVAVR